LRDLLCCKATCDGPGSGRQQIDENGNVGFFEVLLYEVLK